MRFGLRSARSYALEYQVTVFLWNPNAPRAQAAGVLSGASTLSLVLSWKEKVALVSLGPDFELICVIQRFLLVDQGAASHTFQNMMHDAVYVISGVTLIPGLLILSVAFARDQGLRPYHRYTLITPFPILLAGVDVGFFPAVVPERLSILVILIWFEVVAFRLLSLAFHQEPEVHE
jgi:hypothetical protein